MGRIGQSGHAACRRQHFPNEFDAFAGQFGGYASDPGDISARPRKARDQARAHWISRVRHDDWDFAGRLLCRLSGGREPSDDYIDFETDQLGGQFGKPLPPIETQIECFAPRRTPDLAAENLQTPTPGELMNRKSRVLRIVPADQYMKCSFW